MQHFGPLPKKPHPSTQALNLSNAQPRATDLYPPPPSNHLSTRTPKNVSLGSRAFIIIEIPNLNKKTHPYPQHIARYSIKPTSCPYTIPTSQSLIRGPRPCTPRKGLGFTYHLIIRGWLFDQSETQDRSFDGGHQGRYPGKRGSCGSSQS